jgi:hypothetical protein
MVLETEPMVVRVLGTTTAAPRLVASEDPAECPMPETRTNAEVSFSVVQTAAIDMPTDARCIGVLSDSACRNRVEGRQGSRASQSVVDVPEPSTLDLGLACRPNPPLCGGKVRTTCSAIVMRILLPREGVRPRPTCALGTKVPSRKTLVLETLLGAAPTIQEVTNSEDRKWRIVMSNTASRSGDAIQEGELTHDETVRVSEVMRMLDDWKTRVDELKVQVDLAKLDLREEAAKQLDLARNVNYVAASKLRDAYDDAAGTAETLRNGVHAFLRDVDEAFDAVRAVISRS